MSRMSSGVPPASGLAAATGRSSARGHRLALSPDARPGRPVQVERWFRRARSGAAADMASAASASAQGAARARQRCRQVKRCRRARPAQLAQSRAPRAARRPAGRARLTRALLHRRRARSCQGARPRMRMYPTPAGRAHELNSCAVPSVWPRNCTPASTSWCASVEHGRVHRRRQLGHCRCRAGPCRRRRGGG